MKIVFVIGSLGFGGAERVVSVLANQFFDLGHQVTVITLANNICNYPISNGIHTFHIATNTTIKGLSGLQRIIFLKKYISKINSDIVISFTSGVSIYVLLARLFYPFKIIVSERNDPKQDPKNWFLRLVRDNLYKISDGFVFQTIEAKEYFSRKIQKRSAVISNPIKTDLPKPYHSEQSHRIVATGRLVPQKNYPLLLEAFAEFLELYPKYTLDIYGSGPMEEELHNLVLELGIKESVQFNGVVNNWHDYAKVAEIYVLTSDYEGMPNALMEAMAIGLPCIATDCPCGGPSFLINNGINGLLIPVADKKELIKSMKYYASNLDKARLIGRQASIDMRKFNVQTISQSWLNFINDVLETDGV